MAIKFNIHEMGNPSDQDAPKKFYARPVHSGEVTLDELSADISNSSSINESDVYAVLRSLAREIPRQIALGNIVRIEPLGSFYLGCNSSGSATAGEVSSGNIKHKRLVFRASKHAKKRLRDLTFTKNK